MLWIMLRKVPGSNFRPELGLYGVKSTSQRGFRKRRRICWPYERLSASHEWLCSITSVPNYSYMNLQSIARTVCSIWLTHSSAPCPFTNPGLLLNRTNLLLSFTSCLHLFTLTHHPCNLFPVVSLHSLPSTYSEVSEALSLTPSTSLKFINSVLLLKSVLVSFYSHYKQRPLSWTACTRIF